MKSDILELTGQQIADLRRQFQERRSIRARADLAGSLPVPPLPCCPGCGAEAERVDQRVEEPEFDVLETVLRLRWQPCGHVFRAPVDPDEGWL